MFWLTFPMLKFRFLCFRNSRPELYCEKGALRNFTKFTGKHLCQSLFFNKVARGLLSLRPATSLKKRLWQRCFPLNFVKFLITFFLQSTSGGSFLYLNFIKKSKCILKQIRRIEKHKCSCQARLHMCSQVWQEKCQHYSFIYH